jgi:hypothetical protein
MENQPQQINIKAKNPSMQKQNIGNAGEYYMAARLSSENFIATITLGRAERYDIIAINPNGKTIKLSVKTRYLTGAIDFPLSEKDELDGADDFFYAFVRLNEFKTEPEFWIIPSKRVNEILVESEKLYRSIPGKRGQVRKGTSLRILPLITSNFYRSLYPKDWEKELENYYMNLELIKS